MTSPNSQQTSADSVRFETLPAFKVMQKQMEFFAKNPNLHLPFHFIVDGLSTNKCTIEGKEYINYAGYNYLGLSGHPYVEKKAVEAIQKYGTSCSASRVASGSKPLHQQLEKAITELVGVWGAIVFSAGYLSIVFSAGYLSNETVIGHLMTSEDIIFYDDLAHRSLLAGSIESGFHWMTTYRG